MIETNIKNPNK